MKTEQKRKWILSQFKNVPQVMEEYLENQENVELAYRVFWKADTKIGFDVRPDAYPHT